MVRSKHTSAHTMVAVEVDYSASRRSARPEKDRFKEAEGFGLTYLPFITRAVVDALGDLPNVNSSVGDDALIVHHDINLGIAVDLDFEGLLVPVIHQADGKRLRQLAREISGLAGQGPGQAADHGRHLGRHLHHHQRRPVRDASSPCRSSTSPRWPSCPPTGCASGRWWSSCPTAPTPSPSTRSATWSCRGTTGPSTGPTRPPSWPPIKEILETRDWSAEL